MKVNIPLLRMFRNSVLGIAAVLLTFFFPVVSFAETSSTETCTPPSATQAGVNVPTGSDAAMYTYNCDTALWVSDHYTYNPATNVTLPRDPQVYTYNKTTKLWDVDIWTFVASKGAYYLRTFSVSTPPDGATTVGGPEPIAASPDTSSAADTGGSSSTNTSLASPTGSSTNTTNASVSNTIGSTALTGNSTVFGNTLAGSAATGNALTLANVMNLLQSSSSGFSPTGNAVTFVANINGDVNGDLLLDPALVGAVQPASYNADGTLTVNMDNTANAQINNNIDLAAASGNATVDSNTTAGNATSGTATVVANVVNFLNSAIASGQSFLGVININGNLNGDILMPPDFIDQLIASNVPTVTINADANLFNNVNQSINNNVDAAAVSGSATVDKNTSAGNATTGNATTNITAFNLTGSNIVGSNTLLVFVNVLGTWYGMIFNAPGATSAAIGGGITGLSANTDLTATNTANQSITNNISALAASGDATVSKNTTAGSATSGDAKVAVNLLNVANSTMSLANWFGILFINVFGTWNGSFGVNTSAGDPIAAPAAPSAGANNVAANTNTRHLVFRFVPSSSSASGNSAGEDSTEITTTPLLTNGQGAVLAASHVNKAAAFAPHPSNTDKTSFNYWLPGMGVFLGLSMLVGERLRSFRRTF